MQQSQHIREAVGKCRAHGESANNAVCEGALVSMLTFGKLGDLISAIVPGVLLINGIQPGPQLMSEQAGPTAPNTTPEN